MTPGTEGEEGSSLKDVEALSSTSTVAGKTAKKKTEVAAAKDKIKPKREAGAAEEKPKPSTSSKKRGDQKESLTVLEPKRSHEAKTTDTSCKVEFKDKNMSLCHFIPYNGNFGDELGPAAILKLLENKFGCSTENIPVTNLAKRRRNAADVCLFSLGSIFHMVKSGDHIWGTGINPSRQKKYNLENLTFYSVRGPKSEALVREKLNVQGHLGLGDPGFLIPFLYPKYQKDASQQPQEPPRICFVPHAQDMNYTDELGLLPSENVLSVKNSWQPVVESIQKCDYVASSSLHGIIVADAIGIPTLWFQFPSGKTSETEGSFKYDDYFQTVGRMNKTPVGNFSKVFDLSAYDPIIPETERAEVANRTMSSFPYQLFQKTTTDSEESNSK